MPALSYVEHTGDGTEDTFSFASLSLFSDTPKKDQIDVYVDDQIQVYTTNYTVNGTDVVFESGFIPDSGTLIKIARDTQISSKVVTFANSSILTAADLNKNTDQLLFLAQELRDDIDNVALTSVGDIATGAITADKLKQTSPDQAVVTTAIRDLAVTEAKIADDAVTEDKILDGSVTSDKLSAGGPEWIAEGDVTIDRDLIVTGDASVGDNLTVTGDLILTGNVITGAPTVSGNTTFSANVNVDGNLSFDSGYGSTATAYGCRAWVNFPSDNVAGTTVNLSVSCTSPSTTCTATLTNHGFSANQRFYTAGATGLTAGVYTVDSVTNANTFTFITAGQTSTMSSVTVPIKTRSINGSGNVSSVIEITQGSVYLVNLSTELPDTNYVVNATGKHVNAASTVAIGVSGLAAHAPNQISFAVVSTSASQTHVAVFR